MERKRSVSPIKFEKRASQENDFHASNQFRDTNSVKKRLMEKKIF